MSGTTARLEFPGLPQFRVVVFNVEQSNANCWILVQAVCQSRAKDDPLMQIK